MAKPSKSTTTSRLVRIENDYKNASGMILLAMNWHADPNDVPMKVALEMAVTRLQRVIDNAKLILNDVS